MSTLLTQRSIALIDVNNFYVSCERKFKYGWQYSIFLVGQILMQFNTMKLGITSH